jgi:CheY-like chemotaxis protein
MKKKTVLLIDDQPNAMRYYIKALKARGFEVLIVSSADQAWEFFSDPHPEVSVVILDIMMPEGSHINDPHNGLGTGIFLHKRIVAQEAVLAVRKRPLPIAALTNLRREDILEEVRALSTETPYDTFRVWSKLEFEDPRDFVAEFDAWLDSL